MSDTRLSVVVLVIGRRRDELARFPRGHLAQLTLQSLRDQGLTHKDEVFCALVGDKEEARDAFYSSGLSGKLVRVAQPGNEPVTVLTGAVMGKCAELALPNNWLVFCRDGDVWFPGAVRAVRAVLSKSLKDRVHLFANTLSQTDGWHAGTMAVHQASHPDVAAGIISHREVVVLANHLTPESPYELRHLVAH